MNLSNASPLTRRWCLLGDVTWRDVGVNRRLAANFKNLYTQMATEHQGPSLYRWKFAGLCPIPLPITWYKNIFGVAQCWFTTEFKVQFFQRFSYTATVNEVTLTAHISSTVSRTEPRLVSFNAPRWGLFLEIYMKNRLINVFRSVREELLLTRPEKPETRVLGWVRCTKIWRHEWAEPRDPKTGPRSSRKISLAMQKTRNLRELIHYCYV